MPRRSSSAKSKPKPAAVELPDEDVLQSSAASCAASSDCLASAEKQLFKANAAAAKATLGFAVKGARPKNARWLNAAALICLLEGDLFSATSLLRNALQQPFSPATHLPAHKNLYWATHLSREAAESTEPVEQAGRQLLEHAACALGARALCVRLQSTPHARLDRSRPQ